MSASATPDPDTTDGNSFAGYGHTRRSPRNFGRKAVVVGNCPEGSVG